MVIDLWKRVAHKTNGEERWAVVTATVPIGVEAVPDIAMQSNTSAKLIAKGNPSLAHSQELLHPTI